MNLSRLILITGMVVITVSLILQTIIDEDEIIYPIIPLGISEISGFYSPASALVEISFTGSGSGNFSIISLETREVIYTGELSEKIVRVVLPNPGYYGFLINGSYSGTATIRPIAIGFPSDNWRVHLFSLSSLIFILSMTIWREKNDWKI
ncbi:MAG: hypothetical protein PWP39_150 [Pyrococcus sp.]|uniref:hypothetical protein n=1 Tax=Pyrococcus sp. TaxID=33866 RepID=UPI00258E0CAD|nr:hypothetical protein [Pyrococcus sp.]MDK2868915.1 hypothetical protein [Pyrococcus sp.]